LRPGAQSAKVSPRRLTIRLSRSGPYRQDSHFTAGFVYGDDCPSLQPRLVRPDDRDDQWTDTVREHVVTSDLDDARTARAR